MRMLLKSQFEDTTIYLCVRPTNYQVLHSIYSAIPNNKDISVLINLTGNIKMNDLLSNETLSDALRLETSACCLG